MRLRTDEAASRPARELIQQFEPEGRADGTEDDSELTVSIDSSAEAKGGNRDNGSVIRIEIADARSPEKNRSITEGIDPDGILTEEQQIKRAIYRVLADYFGRSLPWGILTGVKPVRFYQKTAKKFPEADTKKLLETEYLLSPGNVRLAAEIDALQEPVIASWRPKTLSLYVGIPVCPAKCSYCSFVSTVLDKKRCLLTDYLPLLENEIRQTGKLFEEYGCVVDSVYIGGGTPSVLAPDEADRLLKVLEEAFDLGNLREFCFEAGRPDTTGPELLRVLADHGVTRVCLNPQSMNADTLTAVNRLYPPEKVGEVYGQIRRAGDFDVNMDLILGLAEESEADFMRSLDEVIAMNPENITVHDLAVKKGTRVKLENGTGDSSRFRPGFFGEIRERLTDAGYLPYYMYRQKYTIGNGENIGWTRPGHESYYNIMMMAEEQTILGIGAGSSGKLFDAGADRFDRVFTEKDLRSYNSRPEELLEKKLAVYRSYLESGVIDNLRVI